MPAFNVVFMLRCTLLRIPFDFLYSSFCRSLCHHLRPFSCAHNTSHRQAPGVDSSKISCFRLRLLVLLESRAIHHKGTHSHYHYGQRRRVWCLNHRSYLCFARRLRYQVVNRQEVPPRFTPSNTGLLFRWGPPSIPRLAVEHDLARGPRSLCAAECHAFKL